MSKEKYLEKVARIREENKRLKAEAQELTVFVVNNLTNFEIENEVAEAQALIRRKHNKVMTNTKTLYKLKTAYAGA